MDRVLDALVHPRRRLLVYRLREAGGAVDIESVAERIAAQECATTPEEVSDDDREAVSIALYHKHLPRLTDLGIVEFDRRSRVVRFEGLPEDLGAILDLARALDDVPDWY